MILSIGRRYRAVALTSSTAMRTEYLEGTGGMVALTVRTEDGTTILSPRGMLMGGRETDELERKIVDLADAGNQQLLINLRETTFMNSMGMAVLFLGHSKWVKRGAQFKICWVRERLRQIFMVCPSSIYLSGDLHETEEQALANFR